MWKVFKQNLRFSMIYLTTVLVTVIALNFLAVSAISTAFVFVSGFLAYMLVGLGFYNVLGLLGDLLTQLGRWQAQHHITWLENDGRASHP